VNQLLQILAEYNYIVTALCVLAAIGISQTNLEEPFKTNLFLFILGSGILMLAGNYAWDLLELGAYRFKDPLERAAIAIVDEAGIREPLRSVIIGQVKSELGGLTPDADLERKLNDVIGKILGGKNTTPKP
jgi:hypothetical protein